MISRERIITDATRRKYALWYISLIEKCNYDHGNLYTEAHHILPRCLYPEFSKDKDNLIRLSAREHFIAHLLLYKAFPKSRKLTFAFYAMTAQKSSNQQRDYTVHSRIYATIKEKIKPIQAENGGLAMINKVVSKNTISGYVEVVSKIEFDKFEHLTGHAKGTTRNFTEAHKQAMRRPHKSVPKSDAHKLAISRAKLGQGHTDETKAKLASHFMKTWTVIYPDAHEETITNLNRFCKDNGLSQGNLYKTLDGKQKHKGYRVRKVHDVETWFDEQDIDTNKFQLEYRPAFPIINKNEKTKKLGIQLFTIFEHEWKERQDKVKAYLLGAMGKYKRRFNARDCIISINPDKKLVRNFLEQWHIQGAPSGIDLSVAIYAPDPIAGVFKELLGVITFAKHHRQGFGDVAVLNRLCWKEGVSIIGGSKRMMHHAKKQYEPGKKIVTWSDNRWSMGGLYERLGFTKEDEYGPDYIYVNKLGEVASKQSKQKKHLKALPHETEEVAAKRQGWERIYDCGKIKWTMIV